MPESRKKFLAISFFLLLICGALYAAPVEPELFSALSARCIGPANMSGRIACIEADPVNPNVIYVGTATGGLWKTTNGGIKWEPIFDDQPVSSIGALALDPTNPNVVWAGTGEANPRNSVGVGRGLYKSLDGGKSWKLLGLEKTDKISRIILNPNNPQEALIAAMGNTWGDNEERGVFKTTDGGKTWKKVLYVNEKTGAADMVVAPDNPNKILVAMWEHRRWPWFFKSGGPGSGLYMSVDGGDSWKKLTDKEGLPAGELGRIGLAFADSTPQVVYALVEAKKNALLKSTDGGYTWQIVNQESGVNGRPFYYCDIRVNPQDEHIIYSLESRLQVSEDGGKSFRSLTGWGQSHPDYHAMWIHPDGNLLMVGNDGGVVISRDRGQTFRFVANLPLAQYYHIGYDMDLPYNIYGGFQDNGSWRGPSQVLTDRVIYDYYWKNVGGGDGFDTQPDPEDSTKGYSMSQGGHLGYYDVTTGHRKNIRPTESDVKHRYSWNAALAIDPFDPATIYYGSQFVHKSPDKGNSWTIISPDLTTNDPEKQKQAESGGLTFDVTGAENHTTILSIAPSPLKKGVIWVGTDDGNVQLTRDGGGSWSLVSTPMIGDGPGLVPAGACVPHVEASKFDADSAFVVFEDHQRANWTPYLFVTHDAGKTWKSLVTDEIDGFVHVIEQDPVDKDLLFIGTEFGLFVSLNGGGNWMKWTHGLPTVPVRDLAVHPREHDLIIATHGRAAYIIDDISPLRGIDDEVLKKSLHFFQPLETIQFRTSNSSSYSSPGDTVFAGENPPGGAMLTYYLIPEEKKAPEPGQRRGPGGPGGEVTPEMRQRMAARFGGRMPPGMERGGGAQSDVKIEILNEAGEVVQTVNGTEKKGLNRVVWDLQEKPMEMPQSLRGFGRGRGGLMVLPGNYTLKIKYHDHEASGEVVIKSDPRFEMDPQVLKSNYDISKELQTMSKSLMTAYQKVEETRKLLKTLGELSGDLKPEEKRKLTRQGRQLDNKLKELAEKVVPSRDQQGITDRSAAISSDIYSAIGAYSNSFEKPTQAAEVMRGKVQGIVEGYLMEFNALFEKDVTDYLKAVEEAGVTLFKPFEPLKLEE